MALTPARFARPAFTLEVSIVTGGASGVGRALATSLLQRGGRVIIADSDAGAAASFGSYARRVLGHEERPPSRRRTCR